MKTIAFDFGNVLGFFDFRIALKKLAAFTDMSVDAMYEAARQSPLEDAYESGRISSSEFLREVRRRCRLSCSADVVAEAWCNIFRPNSAVCSLIPALKPHCRLLLASNTNELHSGHFRREFAETLGHFDHLVLSHEIGVRKPRAGFFERCLAQAHGEPGECLFIDDLPANVEGARSCGWNAILYQENTDLRPRLRELGVAV